MGRKLKPILKKRFLLTLALCLFIPQVYVVMDCLAKGPCTYDYKFNFTFMILWKLLPSLAGDLFVVLAFLFLIVISLVVAFFISTLIIKEKKKF